MFFKKSLPLYLLSGLFLVFTYAGAVAQKSKLPNWVDSPESKYPSKQYLTGLGSGSSLAEAKEKAKSEIANIFSQTIKSSQELRQTVEETVKNDKRQIVEEVQQRSRITVESAAELIGVKIEETAEVFQDGRSRNYALAVLDKNQATTLYQDRYQNHQEQLRDNYRSYTQTNNPIQQLRLLAEARKRAEKARQFRNYYAVLTSLGGEAKSSGESISEEKLRSNASQFKQRMQENLEASERGDDSSRQTSESQSFSEPLPSVGEIDAKMNELMSELTVLTSTPDLQSEMLQSNYTEELQGIIEKQFTSLGFRTASSSENPTVTVSTRLSASETTKGRPGDSAIRWEVTLKMVNSRTDQNFGTISQSGVTVGLDESMAKSRTRDDVNRWLQSDLKQLIIEKLLSI
ncbi:MAG: LPP20 family lipoprotein [bacterium]